VPSLRTQRKILSNHPDGRGIEQPNKGLLTPGWLALCPSGGWLSPSGLGHQLDVCKKSCDSMSDAPYSGQTVSPTATRGRPGARSAPVWRSSSSTPRRLNGPLINQGSATHAGTHVGSEAEAVVPVMSAVRLVGVPPVALTRNTSCPPE
jgi:hypothetical protein